jgi:copper chaperone CopZ
MKTITYNVTGMSCGGWVNRVKTTLQSFGTDVAVTLNTPQAIFTDSTASLDDLNQSLSQISSYTLTANNPSPSTTITTETSTWFEIFRPLLLVFAYLLLISLALEWTHGDFQLHRFMPNFMGGFFLAFSFFTLLDLGGFTNTYAMYDILAKRLPQYGYVYPLIELGLGISYLLDGISVVLNTITFVVMSFSTLGVIIAVSNRQKIRCACLGEVFNLPMSTVTIVEDVLMAAMALWMVMIML